MHLSVYATVRFSLMGVDGHGSRYLLQVQIGKKRYFIGRFRWRDPTLNVSKKLITFKS